MKISSFETLFKILEKFLAKQVSSHHFSLNAFCVFDGLLIFPVEIFIIFCWNMNQSIRFTRHHNCEKHKEPVLQICTAPECNNYRQLCSECTLQDSHHSKIHISQEEAFSTVQGKIQNLFKGLKALRTKIIDRMERNFNSHDGLRQIETNLKEIKELINKKIDNFHLSLKRKYEKEIRSKLNQLFMIVERSHEFLEEEKRRLFKTQRLQPFFVNDLEHQLRYFESHFNEILEKNVHKFKKGFEHDRVLKTVVQFEQNLTEIFKDDFEADYESQPHFFSSDQKMHYKMTLNDHDYARKDLPMIPSEDGWISWTPSVYYSPKNCYYVFGDGKRESNKIRKVQLEKNSFKVLEAKLQTKRVNFATCLLNHQIYIVGGQNSKRGCIVKCQKFVPSEGKTYLVSSLNRKSSQHNLCVIKNRFILKFGGTDIMESILESNADQFHIIPPQIYCLDTEEWKVLQIPQMSPIKNRISFGLWPGVFNVSNERIILIEGDSLAKRMTKHRYELNLQFNGLNIRDIRLLSEFVLLDSKVTMRGNFWSKADGRIYFGAFLPQGERFTIQSFEI